MKQRLPIRLQEAVLYEQLREPYTSFWRVPRVNWLVHDVNHALLRSAAKLPVRPVVVADW